MKAPRSCDKTYAGRLEAGAILEKLFEKEPTHPGLAHYIIHAYDVPALADQALGAARREGQTAEELHASDYEIYAYLQTGQDETAERLVKSLPEIALRFDPKDMLGGAGGPAVGYFALAAMPARYALERLDWKQAEHLALRQTPYPYTDAMTWFARGLGAGQLGHAAAANAAATALHELGQQLSKANEPYWARQVEIQELAVIAWAGFAAGEKRAALRKMESAAVMEDATEKSAVTPGPLAPTRELLAQMLLLMSEPARALLQFEATLKKEPGRFRSLYGAAHAAQLSGSPETSQKYFHQLLRVCARGDTPGRSEVLEAQRAILQ